MRAYKHFIWILALLVSGCASMASPETDREYMTYLEKSYGAVLVQATAARQAGDLSVSQIEDLDAVFDTYEIASSAARLALGSGDSESFDSQTAVIVTSLSAIRILLEGTQ